MTASMEIGPVVAEINSLGWLVNNLFQLDNGWWQANARNAEFATDFGRGETPAEALEAVFDRIHAKAVVPLAEQSTDASVAPVVDLRTILKLNKPVFERRF